MSYRLDNPKFLKLYIPMNSHADDVSGHGNAGTWVGTEAYVEGPHGRSVGSFNGSNAFVQFTQAQTDSFRFNGASSTFSISLWFKKGAAGEAGLLFDCRDSNDDGWRLYAGGSFLFSSVNTVDSSVGLADTNWHHACVTFDLSGDMNLYLDGELGDTDDVSGQTLATTLAARMGIEAYATALKFAGNISAVRIYNMILTQDEVLELGRMGVPKQGTIRRTTADGPDSSLVLQTLIPDATDMSGNGNDGTPTDVKLGDGGVFNGTSSFIGYGNDASLQLASGPLTYLAWIKTTDNEGYVIGKRNGSGGGISWFCSIGKMAMLKGLSLQTASNTTMNDDIWHHIAMTYDGSSVIYYLDGVSDGGDESVVGDIDDTIDLEIGRRQGPSHYLSGSLRDVRVCNMLKSAGWMKQDYLRTRKYH